MPPKRKVASATNSVSSAAPKKKESKKVYGKAPELPQGEVLVDFTKKQWRLGRVIGTGGFGRIYSATKVDDKRESFVVKMEPASNGPLFQETHFYQRVGKEETLRKWQKEKGLDFLGIPAFVAAGLHVKNGQEFRFLILPHLGNDLEKRRASSVGGRLDPAFIFRLAICCLDSLQYLHHSAQYVHADLKAENLLAASDAVDGSGDRFYLVDYGLARKVADQPVYKEAPKKAHDGTLIFTSLDAHRGVTPSYRGDVEILGYNILYWITGSLPWIDVQDDPQKVLDSKATFSKKYQSEITSMPLLSPFSTEMKAFFRHVYSLDYADQPDFDHLRHLMRQAIVKAKKFPSSVDNDGKDTPKTPDRPKRGTTRSNGVTNSAKALPLLRNFITGDDSANTSISEADKTPNGDVPSNSSRKLTRPGINEKTILAKDSLSPSAASSSRLLSPRSIIPGKANMRRYDPDAVAKRRSSILVKRKYLTPKTTKTAAAKTMTSGSRGRGKPHRIVSSDEDDDE